MRTLCRGLYVSLRNEEFGIVRMNKKKSGICYHTLFNEYYLPIYPSSPFEV